MRGREWGGEELHLVFIKQSINDGMIAAEVRRCAHREEKPKAGCCASCRSPAAAPFECVRM